MFLKNPQTIQHLLLFGPPGSGKTTSANWLVEQIWSNRKSLMCISMNAADERSLESIRQKVFPFLRVDWRNETERAPRFLILDECETLTEAAQLSLQTILNFNPKDICVILICNSQSRIHPKLRQRLLKIRYDPPNKLNEVCDIFTAITRGDLRQSACLCAAGLQVQLQQCAGGTKTACQ
jgi:DNA polymerase III delta prime subunit